MNSPCQYLSNMYLHETCDRIGAAVKPTRTILVTARTRSVGKIMFSVCGFVHRGGGTISWPKGVPLVVTPGGWIRNQGVPLVVHLMDDIHTKGLPPSSDT